MKERKMKSKTKSKCCEADQRQTLTDARQDGNGKLAREQRKSLLENIEKELL